MMQRVILEQNDRLIEQFLESLPPGLSQRRLKKYRYTLGKIGLMLNKRFEEASKQDLRAFISKVNESEFKDWTKRTYKVIAKKFFRWLHNKEFVKDIRVGSANNRVIPEDLLSKRDLDQLLDACGSNLRNRALISTLYESGCRPEEFISLRKKDIVFDDFGAVLIVRKGKTGSRRVRLLHSAPYLANWIEHHPLKDSDKPLWSSFNNDRKNRATYLGLCKVLDRLVGKSGIQKKINLYTFRHSRATELANILTEAQMCEYFGWIQGSSMPRIYVHMSGRNVDETLLAAAGLKQSSQQVLEKPLECPRCGTKNPSKAERCMKCGLIFDMQLALQEDQLQKNEIDELRKQLEDERMGNEELEKRLESIEARLSKMLGEESHKGRNNDF